MIVDNLRQKFLRFHERNKLHIKNRDVIPMGESSWGRRYRFTLRPLDRTWNAKDRCFIPNENTAWAYKLYYTIPTFLRSIPTTRQRSVPAVGIPTLRIPSYARR